LPDSIARLYEFGSRCAVCSQFGNQDIEHLQFKPNDPIAREMAQMRAELQRDPRNLEVAVRLARRYYGLVAEEGIRAIWDMRKRCLHLGGI